MYCQVRIMSLDYLISILFFLLLLLLFLSLFALILLTFCNTVSQIIVMQIKIIIIRCKCFFLFIGQKPTTWPANNCLQIMVCSCAMSFNCFWLQILFCSCVNETTLFSVLRSLLHENGRSLRFPKIFLGDRMIKQLLNSVIAKYRDFSVSRRSIICFSLRLRQIIDLLATDKSRYFAQPRPIIIANCCCCCWLRSGCNITALRGNVTQMCLHPMIRNY